MRCSAMLLESTERPHDTAHNTFTAAISTALRPIQSSWAMRCYITKRDAMEVSAGKKQISEMCFAYLLKAQLYIYF